MHGNGRPTVQDDRRSLLERVPHVQSTGALRVFVCLFFLPYPRIEFYRFFGNGFFSDIYIVSQFAPLYFFEKNNGVQIMRLAQR